jgi:hypothetical protein
MRFSMKPHHNGMCQYYRGSQFFVCFSVFSFFKTRMWLAPADVRPDR